METRSTRPRSLVGPAILIAMGSLFLASNLGLLSRDAWLTIIQFWPLILVAVGLDILLRRSSIGSVASAVSLALVLLVVVALAAGAAIAAPYVTIEDGNFSVTTATTRASGMQFGDAVRSESFNQSLDGAKRANVELSLGVGTMHVGAMSESNDDLVGATLALGENERVSRDYHVSGDTGYFRLRSKSEGPSGINDRGQRQWDLKLNPNVPTELKINGGVGNTNLDLSALQLTGLNIHAGVSNTEVRLPEHGRFQASIDGGVGDLTIMVPRGMGARIQVEKGLSSVEIGAGYDANGNTYVSRDYSSATDRVEMKIHGGIGRISVQEY